MKTINVACEMTLPDCGVILLPLVSSFFSLVGDSASKGSEFHDCQLPASRAFNNLLKNVKTKINNVLSFL